MSRKPPLIGAVQEVAARRIVVIDDLYGGEIKHIISTIFHGDLIIILADGRWARFHVRACGGGDHEIDICGDIIDVFNLSELVDAGLLSAEDKRKQEQSTDKFLDEERRERELAQLARLKARYE
jgi:hypothetical protein